jgi:hypothetical protein
MSEHLKIPKETKQHGELNNVQTSKPKNLTSIAFDGGTYSYTLPPPPNIVEDNGEVTIMKLADGKMVTLQQYGGFGDNFRAAYGPNGVRDAFILAGESIAKGLVTDNPWGMAAIMTGRVLLSSAKKYVGADGHGEHSAASSLAYGTGVNLIKFTGPGYFGAFGKNNKTWQWIAHKSHKIHKVFDKYTIKGVSIGTKKLGELTLQPFSLQWGANRLEANYLSGGAAWYAFNSHGASNGGNGGGGHAAASTGHPVEVKIESETLRHAVEEAGHTTNEIEKSAFAQAQEDANIMSYNTADKGAYAAEAELKRLKYDGDGGSYNKKVLWIAEGLNHRERHRGETNSRFWTENDSFFASMINLDDIQITPDIRIAQALLKKSGKDYDDITENHIYQTAPKAVGGVMESILLDIAPLIDIGRVGFNTMFGSTDAENLRAARALNVIAIKEQGGTITHNKNGSITVTVDPRKAVRARADETYVKKPNINVKTLEQVQKEKAKAQLEFGQQMQTINAYNRERITGIKAGTVNNPLPGQPFVTNTPQNVFGRTNINPSGKSGPTISQNRNPFSK